MAVTTTSDSKISVHLFGNGAYILVDDNVVATFYAQTTSRGSDLLSVENEAKAVALRIREGALNPHSLRS